MTAEEESIVKHKVNCGRLKNRLALFILGMDSIKEKVHLVFAKQCNHLCMYCVCTYSSGLRNMAHSESALLAVCELVKCFGI